MKSGNDALCSAFTAAVSDEKELPKLHADEAHGETEMPDETQLNTRCSGDPNTRCSGVTNTRCSGDPNTQYSGDPYTSPQSVWGRVVFRAI